MSKATTNAVPTPDGGSSSLSPSGDAHSLSPRSDESDSLAMRYKAEGDEHTRSRRFELAEASYSQALDAAPSAHTVWGNRSLVRLKLNRFDDAAADALRATHLGKFKLQA